MKQIVYNEFLLRTKDKKLLRFKYKDTIGIYYETIINNKIINRKVAYKDSLKYFYIMNDYNDDINLICQDIYGNILLGILKNDDWVYRNLFNIKDNFITPINIKGVFLEKDLNVIYNLDSNSNTIYFNNKINSIDTIIYDDKSNIEIKYNILSGENDISLIIYSISFDMFKLILKTYNAKNDTWSRNKIIFIDNHNYEDMSFCKNKNKVHSLIIINEDNKKLIIYKNIRLDKNEENQKEIIIYEDSDIYSCLIVEFHSIIWAIWTSNNKLYGCYSTNNGEDFSKPLIYKDITTENIRKIILVEGYTMKETYIIESEGYINLFLEELLIYNHPLDINYKEITYSFKEKEKFNVVIKKIKNLEEIVDNQKSQILSLENNIRK
ncbi:hypothetical protein ACQPVP_04750 [Clostridium nigeriense]|uniref:hypothetical protein n=1 Tax=Clostridium nigeriense TaxID=1805470 RepID=UPI003D34A3FA